MKKLIPLFLTVLVIFPFFSLTKVALADDPFDPAVAPPPGTIDNITANDVVRIIVNTRNWFAGIVLIIAVTVVLFAGFTYMTAGGDDKKIDLARRILKNAVIGIVVTLLAYGIVGLITNLINDLRS